MLTFIFGVVCFGLGIGFMPVINFVGDMLYFKARHAGHKQGYEEGFNAARNIYDKD